MTDRQTVTFDQLKGLIDAEERTRKPTLDEDRLQEYSVAALATLRGLTRTDKLKVIRRMTKMLRP